MWTVRTPAPQPDPSLNRYRKSAARLYDGEHCVAHLLTRVNVWWTVEGPWWRRRHVDPQERVEWHLDFEPGIDFAHADGWDDGIEADVPDLDQGRFVYRGRSLRVVWLDGKEAEEQFSANGWERHD